MLQTHGNANHLTRHVQRMKTLKIECPCGQHYAFDVEPVDGRMPWEVRCPTCGADGTAAANQLLAQSAVASPPPLLRLQSHTPRGEVSETPPPLRQQLTAQEVRSGAWASNPGRLRPDMKQVYRAWPAYWTVPGVVAVASAIAGFWNPYFFIGLAIAAWQFWDGYREVSNLLLNGDVCAGRVISERPPRVAVLTNMSAQGAYHPAIKILEQPIMKAFPGPLEAGTRVASVAFYHGPITPTGDWRNFGPMVINTLVSDPVEIQRVMRSISEEEWSDLDNYLTRLSTQNEGLYAMHGPMASKVEAFSKGDRRGFKMAVIFLGILVCIAIMAGLASGVVALLQRRQTQTPVSQTHPTRENFGRPNPATLPPESRFPNAGNNPGAPRGPGIPPMQNGFAGIHVGDKVEVRGEFMDRGQWQWKPGTVEEFARGQFRIKMDEGGPDRWVSRGSLRPRN